MRAIRYLKGARELGHAMRGGKDILGKISLDLFSDTNYAPGYPTKRAMTCGTSFVDGMPFSCFAKRQAVQSTSSGEAEFYGCESVVNEALGLQGVYEDFDIHLAVNPQTDSTAAIGMIQRRCTGKICIHLHLQELIRNDRIGSIEIIKTELNVAEIGTTHLDVANMNELLELLMVSFVDSDGTPHPNVGQMAKIAHMLKS